MMCSRAVDTKCICGSVFLHSFYKIQIADFTYGRLGVIWSFTAIPYKNAISQYQLEATIPADGAIMSGYASVINKYAPHPYAAALSGRTGRGYFRQNLSGWLRYHRSGAACAWNRNGISTVQSVSEYDSGGKCSIWAETAEGTKG